MTSQLPRMLPPDAKPVSLVKRDPSLLRHELLSLSITREGAGFGVHVVALDDRGTPRHDEYDATSRHGAMILAARAVARWGSQGGRYASNVE